jgi:hypothetical protein
VEELNIQQIETALRALQSKPTDDNAKTDKHDLAAALGTEGETMPLSELQKCVSFLMGNEQAWWVRPTVNPCNH